MGPHLWSWPHTVWSHPHSCPFYWRYSYMLTSPDFRLLDFSFLSDVLYLKHFRWPCLHLLFENWIWADLPHQCCNTLFIQGDAVCQVNIWPDWDNSRSRHWFIESHDYLHFWLGFSQILAPWGHTISNCEIIRAGWQKLTTYSSSPDTERWNIEGTCWYPEQEEEKGAISSHLDSSAPTWIVLCRLPGGGREGGR